VIALVVTRSRISFDEILRRFYRDATIEELKTMVETLAQMGEISIVYEDLGHGKRQMWIKSRGCIDPGIGG